MEELLLHACCGPCSTVVVPAWRAQGLEPTALFVNPNIHPEPEFARRLEAMEYFSEAADLRLIVDQTVTAGDWLTNLAAASPGEERCAACLRLRLRVTALAARERGIGRMSTTLSLSPYQRHDLIRREGLAAAEESGVEFLYADMRPLFERSYAESRRLGLYRQKYCGCVLSKWEAYRQRLAVRGAARRSA